MLEMRFLRMLIINLAGVVCFTPLAAFAQPVVTTHDGLAIWYDVRPTAAEILAPSAPFTRGTQHQGVFCKCATVTVPYIEAGNGGGPGDGQTLFMSPRMPLNPIFGLGLHWTGAKSKSGVLKIIDNSRKSLYRYITVQSRGGVDEVIVSLGLHTELVKQGTPNLGNALEQVSVNQTPSYWDSTSELVEPAGTQESDVFSIDTYASRTPTDDGGVPVYNPSGGLVPSLQPYRIGEIEFVAGVWKKGVQIRESTYQLRDSVNDGFVVRADSGGLSPNPEEPDFGYTTDVVFGTAGSAGVIYRSGSWLNSNLPEAHSGGDGLTIGTTSVQPDATVVIVTKGDFNYDGSITSGDFGSFNFAMSMNANGYLRIRERYLGDFNNDGTVTAGDIAFLSQCATTTADHDCSIPANCP